MSDKTKSQKPSVQFNMSESSYERLLALQKKCEANDLGDILKNALRLYESFIEEAEAGSVFFIKRKENAEPVVHEIF